jgi:hypothetical protein
MENKNIYEMGLHETIFLENPNCQIIRVASGWIYKFYTTKYNNLSEPYNELSSTLFVPFDNKFQK